MLVDRRIDPPSKLRVRCSLGELKVGEFFEYADRPYITGHKTNYNRRECFCMYEYSVGSSVYILDDDLIVFPLVKSGPERLTYRY